MMNRSNLFHAAIHPFWLAVGLLVLAGQGHAGQLSDPTAPPSGLSVAPVSDSGASETTVEIPKLTAIIVRGRYRQAVLDGKAVRIGDRHGPYEIQSILPGRVVLVRNGEPTSLTLAPAIKKSHVRRQ